MNTRSFLRTVGTVRRMELSLFAISRVALMNLIVDGEPSERANEQTEKKPSDQYSIEAERERKGARFDRLSSFSLHLQIEYKYRGRAGREREKRE